MPFPLDQHVFIKAYFKSRGASIRTLDVPPLAGLYLSVDHLPDEGTLVTQEYLCLREAYLGSLDLLQPSLLHNVGRVHAARLLSFLGCTATHTGEPT